MSDALPDESGFPKVTYADALEITRAIVEQYEGGSRPFPGYVVLVGGTALAALGIRERSEDHDTYIPEIDDGAIIRVERQFRGRFGPAFKIDATAVDTLWGAFSVRDIDQSTVMETLDVGSRRVLVKSLDPETLYVVKLSANRPKDLRDLRLIAPRTSADAVVARFNKMLPWHSDRRALPSLVERFSRHCALDFGRPISEIDAAVEVHPEVMAMAMEARQAHMTQFRGMGRSLVKARRDLVSIDPDDGTRLRFDFGRLDVPEEMVQALNEDPAIFQSILSEAFKEADPAAYARWIVSTRSRTGPAGPG